MTWEERRQEAKAFTERIEREAHLLHLEKEAQEQREYIAHAKQLLEHSTLTLAYIERKIAREKAQ